MTRDVEQIFEEVHKLIDRHTMDGYKKAFQLLCALAYDDTQPPHVRANAFCDLGVLTQIAPQYGDGDECGLSYYKRGLELVPDHLWCLYGVVSTFGETFPAHGDLQAARSALEILSRRLDEIDHAETKEFILKQAELIRRKADHSKQEG